MCACVVPVGLTQVGRPHRRTRWTNRNHTTQSSVYVHRCTTMQMAIHICTQSHSRVQVPSRSPTLPPSLPAPSQSPFAWYQIAMDAMARCGAGSICSRLPVAVLINTGRPSTHCLLVFRPISMDGGTGSTSVHPCVGMGRAPGTRSTRWPPPPPREHCRPLSSGGFGFACLRASMLRFAPLIQIRKPASSASSPARLCSRRLAATFSWDFFCARVARNRR